MDRLFTYFSVHTRHGASCHPIGYSSAHVDVIPQQVLEASVTELKELVRVCGPTFQKKVATDYQSNRCCFLSIVDGVCVYLLLLLFTRVSVVCIEEVDLLPPVPVYVAGGHPDGVPQGVSQGVEWRAAVIHRYVHQPLLTTVILQDQVRTVVPENGEH